MKREFRYAGLMIAGLFLFLPLFLFAQPRGDEPRKIRAILADLSRKVAEKTGAIEKQPRNAKPYAERGALYIEIYRTLYHSYYGSFYDEKPPELSVSALASKAVADLSRAIEIAPESAFYAARADMYAVRWHDTVKNINWYTETERLENPEWRGYLQPPRAANELKTLEKVIRDPDFAAARADYEKALRLAPDDESRKKFHDRLARLYHSRVSTIYGNLKYNKNLVVDSKAFGYFLFADVDQAAAELQKGNLSDAENASSQFPRPWFLESPLTIRQVLYFKAEIAHSYGKNALALKSLNAAAKFTDKTRSDDFFNCSFYPFRSRLNTIAGKLDAALADADVLYAYGNSPPQLCYEAYEARGDALFAKNDFRAAAADYSRTIEMSSYTRTELPATYKKRALAYLKLGEYEKAAADLTETIAYQSTAENFLLRARAYRRLNETEKAAADEERAERAAENERQKERRAGIYGRIVLPDGTRFGGENSRVVVVYSNNETENWTPSSDGDGRFVFYPSKPLPFSIFAYFDAVRDGVPVRYFVRTAPFRLKKEIEGPIVIKLERFVRRAVVENKK